jgi:peptidoglycan/LPS O-acetylase OafA/YrhL
MELARVHSKQHLPALDGLRGVAILGVLCCHFVRVSPEASDPVSRWVGLAASYGWLGVDLFFVLSGFLITGILLDTKGGPDFFRNFYARRILRIFPLYYAYLCGILMLGLAYWLLKGATPRVHDLFADGLWAFPYLTNVQVAVQKTNVSTVLNHFWSLGIEEQFYLIWPAVVALTSRRQLGAVCGVSIFLAAVARELCRRLGYTQAADVLMPCRADSLALGGLLALAARSETVLAVLSRIPRCCLVLPAIPAIACATAIVRVPGALQPGLVAIAFGALLLLALSSSKQSRTGRLFGSGVLRTLGKYSYGLYVLNQPVAFFPGNVLLHQRLARLLKFPLAATAVHALAGIGVTFVLAWLSWHLLEQHFLKLKRLFV